MITPVEAAWLAVLEKIGSKKAVSRICGCTSQNVDQWKRVPEEHCQAISRATGIPKWRLRPDIHWRPDEPRKIAA